MKIAYILPQGKGGIPHYAAELANAVSNYEEVALLKPTESTADDIISDKIHVFDVFEDMNISNANLSSIFFEPLRNLRASESYRQLKILRNIDPDIIHFAAPASLLPQAQLFTKYYRIDDDYPVVETFHDVYEPGFVTRGENGKLNKKESIKSVLFENIFKVIQEINPSLERDHAIVHTDTNKNALEKSGYPEGKISVLPHGTYDLFKQYNHESVDEEDNTILFFGNLVSSKAPDTAIKSIPHIREEINDITLIVAGNGKITNECKNIIREYPDNFEVDNRFIPNELVGKYFQRSQLVIIPHRRQDGHSGTLTIAYSYNKPVVTSDIGDFPRLVNNPDCGSLAPVNEPKQFAEEIVKLLRNDARRQTMKNNTQIIADKHSWDNIAREHIKIYKNLHD